MERTSITLPVLDGTSLKLATVEVIMGTRDPSPTPRVKETIVRVRCAINGLFDHERKVPAFAIEGDVSPAFDLAVAMAVLNNMVDLGLPDRGLLWLGELSMQGYVRPVRGAALYARHVQKSFNLHAIVPAANAAEFCEFCEFDSGGVCRPVSTLAEAFEWASTQRTIEPLKYYSSPLVPVPEAMRRNLPATLRKAWDAVAPAAALGRNLLLVSPPGAGKTAIVRRLAYLRPFGPAESDDATCIHSAAGLIGGDRGSRVVSAPFRAPHHTVSDAGLLGGGAPVRPGEVVLASHGVLMLDELPEFRLAAIEALCDAMREGCVRRRGVSMPFDTQIVGAANRCPCGWLGAGDRCTCKPSAIKAYNATLGRVADALNMQRIDLPPMA